MQDRQTVRFCIGVLLACGLLFLGSQRWRHTDFSAASADRHSNTSSLLRPSSQQIINTAHYAITSSATPAQTQKIATAVEILYTAYNKHFDMSARATSVAQGKMPLRLYKDQEEFKQHNQSRPWAEAYYQFPTCYAYYPATDINPYHWMLHEATHQLNVEVAHFKLSKWLDEGLATYFSTSKIQNGLLVPGTIDPNTYPIWWLHDIELTNDVHHDLAMGKIIPLRVLISDTGSGSDDNVNRYYIGYWSLTYFLWHFDNARYAEPFRQLILAGGSAKDFERLIGPIDEIEVQWHTFLRQRIAILTNRNQS
jgi:Protein of unknown function (DUF1570)